MHLLNSKLSNLFFIYNLLVWQTVNIVWGGEEIQVTLQLKEETPPFTRIGSISPALPNNLGSKLHYMTDSRFFSVASNVGDVRVARLIDRERLCPEFKLCCGVLACQLDARIFVTNIATGDFAASVVLKVDIVDQNDNRPTFATPNQVLSVSEATPIGTNINVVPATDADVESTNQIQRYSLIEPTGTFVLDSTDLPAVRLRLARGLDREVVSSYTATLEACDPGACARQTIDIQVLDENDNQPVFASTSINKRLMENIRVGSVLMHLNATDPDSGDRGRVVYTMHGNVDPDLLDTFDLVHDTGEIRLKRPLAANIRDNYHFKVLACNAVNPSCSNDNNSTVEIKMFVEDVNNFAPTIHAVAAGGATIVTDNEAKGPDQSDETGFRDGLSVLENTAPTQVAVLTVRDDDLGENAHVTCNLNDTTTSQSSVSTSSDFILTLSAPGIYSLRTARMFDYELEPTVSAKVVCHDFGEPQQLTSARLITVKVVDVNEFQPEFSRRVYIGRVPENAPAGMEILTATANDRDRGARLQYRLANLPGSQGSWNEERTESGDGNMDKGMSKYFVIDEETGIIRTSQIHLDRETVTTINLIVVVSDSKFPLIFTATATVSIEVLDENDNAPVFINPPAEVVEPGNSFTNQNGPKPFTVMENAPRFTRLSEQLEAHDPDQGDNGRVHFSLLETYAFTRVAHMGLSSNNPYGVSKMAGSKQENTVDIAEDLGLSRKLVDQPIFRITPDGGIETLLELDRETVPMYVLKIGVQDRGVQPLTSTVMLRVDVLDVNDNAPFWVFPTSSDRVINLTTAMKPGSLAVRLRAEDADAGDSGRMEYLFLGPRGEALRGMNLHDGFLKDLLVNKNDS